MTKSQRMLKTSTGFARQLRKNATDAERLLWKHIRNRQIDGHKFRRQYPIEPYTVDFICLERQLIIEVDGGQHAQQITQDTERSDWLAAKGYRILRFWNNEVLANISGVVAVIRSHLE